MSNQKNAINEIKKGLDSTQLEDRLEMVQLANAAAAKDACINGKCKSK